MATFFVDIDGTCFKYHTQEWLPGVKAHIERLYAAGHRFYFITMRDHVRDAGTDWSVDGTIERLNELSFPPTLITNVSTPRIVVCDSQPFAIPTDTDSGSWLQRIKIQAVPPFPQ